MFAEALLQNSFWLTSLCSNNPCAGRVTVQNLARQMTVFGAGLCNLRRARTKVPNRLYRRADPMFVKYFLRGNVEYHGGALCWEQSIGSHHTMDFEITGHFANWPSARTDMSVNWTSWRWLSTNISTACTAYSRTIYSRHNVHVHRLTNYDAIEIPSFSIKSWIKNETICNIFVM